MRGGDWRCLRRPRAAAVRLLARWLCIVGFAGLLAAAGAQAQFDVPPAPLPVVASPSTAETDDDYRLDAARHLYARYAPRIHKGRLPAGLYGIAVIETEVDAAGQVVAVRVRRSPAAAEVLPWIDQMIRRAAPFPPPVRLGRARYLDVWLVEEGGNFQLDALTEGQD